MSANATSTISTAHRDVSHHVHTASFELADKKDRDILLSAVEHIPAEQSVSFDDAVAR